MVPDARMAELIAELEEPGAGEQREDNNRGGLREKYIVGGRIKP